VLGCRLRKRAEGISEASAPAATNVGVNFPMLKSAIEERERRETKMTNAKKYPSRADRWRTGGA
jgi:hypothetical protein